MTIRDVWLQGYPRTTRLRETTTAESYTVLGFGRQQPHTIIVTASAKSATTRGTFVYSTQHLESTKEYALLPRVRCGPPRRWAARAPSLARPRGLTRTSQRRAAQGILRAHCLACISSAWSSRHRAIPTSSPPSQTAHLCPPANLPARTPPSALPLACRTDCRTSQSWRAGPHAERTAAAAHPTANMGCRSRHGIR